MEKAWQRPRGAELVKKYSLQFEFKVQDCWIGVFWRRVTSSWVSPPMDSRVEITSRPRLDVWICIVPCIPLHFTVLGKPEYETIPCGSTPLENAFLGNAEMHGWSRTVKDDGET